ncbi:tb-292 membrane associated protein-like protein [Trypanosoma cruzi]|uniref:Tb-292 membrane associated protein-like protein n=1 Tax=Trypanosoma cruzi TaxID=5693 RepID=A0A2V2UU10_TRYCR|nr:tb-292 membrane associated protein-like protein [Trypanosoma cruzi]
MQSPVRNAAAIAATEEALRGRVEELALARAAAEDVLLAKYPFFAALPGAVLLANEDIKRSPLFATLAARYEELAAQPEVDESELETVKEALLQSAARLLSEEKEAEQAAAEARNALHAQYPMCARDVGDAVAKDPTIAGLIARRSELLKDPVGNVTRLLMWTTFCTGAVSRWRPHASAVGSLCSPMGFLPLTTLSPTTGSL